MRHGGRHRVGVMSVDLVIRLWGIPLHPGRFPSEIILSLDGVRVHVVCEFVVWRRVRRGGQGRGIDVSERLALGDIDSTLALSGLRGRSSCRNVESRCGSYDGDWRRVSRRRQRVVGREQRFRRRFLHRVISVLGVRSSEDVYVTQFG